MPKETKTIEGKPPFTIREQQINEVDSCGNCYFNCIHNGYCKCSLLGNKYGVIIYYDDILPNCPLKKKDIIFKLKK